LNPPAAQKKGREPSRPFPSFTFNYQLSRDRCRHETIVFSPETIVFTLETIVDDSETVVDDPETIVDDPETIVDDSQTIVDDSETIVFSLETIVLRRKPSSKSPKSLAPSSCIR